MAGAVWIDHLDPTLDEIRAHLPASIHARALEQLVEPTRYRDEPRPKLESHGDYVFGVLLVPVVVREEDVLYFQEIDLATSRHALVTVRKTPGGRRPYDSGGPRRGARHDDTAGALLYRLVDDVAERYLDVIDELIAEIDELEDAVEELPPPRIRERLSALRHDILHLRRNLAPTRDAIREVVENRVELAGGDEVFTRDVELSFDAAYDKLLRATDGLELARELVASVRDYYQAKIAHEQNDIVKRLTAIAALLLFPTFWVGVYGQNFEHMPELDWRLGYLFSWGVVVVVTAAQLAFFRRRKWL